MSVIHPPYKVLSLRVGPSDSSPESGIGFCIGSSITGRRLTAVVLAPAAGLSPRDTKPGCRKTALSDGTGESFRPAGSGLTRSVTDREVAGPGLGGPVPQIVSLTDRGTGPGETESVPLSFCPAGGVIHEGGPVT